MDRALHLAARLGESLLRALPPRSVAALSWIIGTAWYALDRRRRKRCRANLLAVYGLASAADVRTVFRNMARVPLEVIWFPRLMATKAQCDARYQRSGAWDGFATDQARGGLLLTGHLGNWEFGAHAMRHVPVRLAVIARRFAQAGLDQRLQGTRGGDEAVIEHRNALGSVRHALRDHRWIGIVGDQNAGWNGQFVPFFGMPASTAGAPSLVALREQAPVYFGAVRRLPGLLRFEVHLERAPGAATSDRRAALRALLIAYMAFLERRIQLDPLQYNWLHRRWKSRPPGEAPDPRLPQYDHHRPPNGSA